MEVIGDYEINTKDNLGKGSFGEVVRGRHIPTNSPVAAKRIVFYSEEDKENVQLEVTALQKAKGHPNVLQLLHHEVVGDVLWIITEHCEGSNLSDLVESTNPDLRLKLEIMNQSAAALSHMNNLSPDAIVHRDIKADNILIKMEGTNNLFSGRSLYVIIELPNKN